MKRTVPPVLSAGIALLLFLGAAGKVDALRKASSPSIQVTIDGLSFMADGSDEGDTTLLRRELARLGVQPPDTLTLPEETRTAHPAFSGKLAGSPKQRTAYPPDVPRGLRPEHYVRMGEAVRTVDLVVGRVELPGASVRSVLAAKGWIPVSMEGNTRLPRMLEATRGKETAVVCLDETDGTFLIVRKMDR